MSTNTTKHSKPLTCIELCAGAGGQSLGLEWSGFDHLALVEIDEHCCNTIRLNRPEWRVLQADVREIASSPVIRTEKPDLLAAGLPCPPFSVAGKQLGQDDERDLFPAALDIVKALSPRAIMIENVKGFLGPAFKDYREHIRSRFQDMGYTIDWRLLNASDYGVSQLRPRVVIVGLQSDDMAAFEWPEPVVSPPPSVGDELYDLMSENGWKRVEEWRKKANGIAPTLVGGSKKHGGPDLGPTRAKKAWAELGVNAHSIAEEAPIPKFVGMPRLTVRMAARLQGFPDDWQFFGKKTAAYRQVGNAFPPPVAHAVSTQIAQVLRRKRAIKHAV